MAATLSKKTTEILQICKPLLEENKKPVGETFYRKLFEQHPEVRGLFSRSEEGMRRQSLNLANALVDFTANCHQLEQLLPFVERVASRHVALGVQPEHYPVVGGILLETLEEVLGGEVVTTEVREAIAEGYFLLADIFIAAEKKKKEESIGKEQGYLGIYFFKTIVASMSLGLVIKWVTGVIF